VTNGELFAALLVDVAVLTGQLYYAGGITNPFIFLFLLQVAVASVLLRPATWAIVHHQPGFVALTLWHRPLACRSTGNRGAVAGLRGRAAGVLRAQRGAAGDLHRPHQRATCAQRDARLAKLRQRAAEEEHIVRMGLLASGAAHELGTPLATLSVILGDWRAWRRSPASPNCARRSRRCSGRSQRCKASSAASCCRPARRAATRPGDHAACLPRRLVEEWRTTPPGASSTTRTASAGPAHHLGHGLKQMMGNVLDNALEAAPGTAAALVAAGTTTR
jgi:two-component system sensor histidine kinase RegB